MKYKHKHNTACVFTSLTGSPIRPPFVLSLSKDGEEGSVGLKGFVLLELIVATLIASMISGILLTALSQSSRIQLAVDNVIDMSERFAIVTHQLEKDLAGAFVPEQAEKRKDADKKEEQPGKKPETAEQKPAPQKKEPKVLEKIFYSTNKDGMLDTLSFVTNNPLVVFVGKDVGVVKPKVARVQYTLKPEPERKGAYALYRQESSELDVAEYKNVRPYELIGGIKKCTVQFTARIEKKQEEKAGKETKEAPQEKQKISYEYKTMNEWKSEQKKEETDKKQAEFPRIPYAVEWKITLWDTQDKKDKEYTIVCEIPVDSLQAKKPEEEQGKEEKKPEPTEQDKNKAAPGGGSTPGKPEKTGQEVANNQRGAKKSDPLADAIDKLLMMMG